MGLSATVSMLETSFGFGVLFYKIIITSKENMLRVMASTIPARLSTLEVSNVCFVEYADKSKVTPAQLRAVNTVAVMRTESFSVTHPTT